MVKFSYNAGLRNKGELSLGCLLSNGNGIADKFLSYRQKDVVPLSCFRRLMVRRLPD